MTYFSVCMGGADSIVEAAEARPDVIDPSRLDPHVKSLRTHTARGTLVNSSFQLGLVGLGTVQRFAVAAYGGSSSARWSR